MATLYETDLRSMSDEQLFKISVSAKGDIAARWGMHNGLVTCATEMNGAHALETVMEICDELGWTMKMVGTNDDQVGIIVLNTKTDEETKRAVDECCDALVAGLRMFGITANRAKMVIGGPGAEINTLEEVVQRGRPSTVLAANRGNISASKGVMGTANTDTAKAAIMAAASGLKEGCDLTTAMVVTATAWLTHYKRAGLQSLMTNAMSKHDASEKGYETYRDTTAVRGDDGLGALGDGDVAPHLTGLPCFKPYLNIFGAESILAVAIIDRLVAEGKRAELIAPAVVKNLAIEKLGSLLPKDIETDWKVDKDVLPPEGAVAVGPPSYRAANMLSKMSVKDPLLRTSTFQNTSFAAMNKASGFSMLSQIHKALHSERSNLEANPFRIKDTIAHQAGYGRSQGNMATPVGDKRNYILSQLYRKVDGTYAWYSKSANMASILRACRGFDWTEGPSIIGNDALDSMAGAIMRNYINARRAEEEVTKMNGILITGVAEPTTVSTSRDMTEDPALSLAEVAKLIAPSEAIGQAIDYTLMKEGKIVGSESWKYDMRAVRYNDVQRTIQTAAALMEMMKPIKTHGYVVRAVNPKIDSVQLAITQGTRHLGFHARAVYNQVKEDPAAQALIPMKKEVTAINNICADLASGFVRKTQLKNHPAEKYLGVLPHGTGTEGTDTTLDAGTMSGLVSGMIAAASGVSITNVTARTIELVSKKAQSASCRYLKPKVMVKAVRHVHWMHNAKQHGLPIHCLAAIEKTLKHDDGEAPGVYKYVLKVWCPFTKDALKGHSLVVPYRGVANWIKIRDLGNNVPGTDMPISIEYATRLHCEVQCFPPAYCLSTETSVFPVANTTFDTNALCAESPIVPRGLPRSVNVAELSILTASTCLAILRAEAPVRNSVLHMMGALGPYAAMKEFVKGCVNVGRGETSDRTRNGPLINDLRRIYADYERLRRKRESTKASNRAINDITSALILIGGLKIAYLASKDAVQGCGFFAREMQTPDAHLRSIVRRTALVGLDIEDLSYAPDTDLPLDLTEVEHSTSVEVVEVDDSDDDFFEAVMRGVGPGDEVTDLSTNLDEETTLEVAVGYLKSRAVDETERDGFGNEVTSFGGAGGVAVGILAEDIQEARTMCLRSHRDFIETPMSHDIPISTSCGPAFIKAMLDIVKECYKSEPGLASARVMGSSSIYSELGLYQHAVKYSNHGIILIVDTLIGLGYRDQVKLLVAQCSNEGPLLTETIALGKDSRALKETVLKYEKGGLRSEFVCTTTSVSSVYSRKAETSAFRTIYREE